jgi:hypothetical protein
MQALRVETIVQNDGSLTVKDLPFQKGEVVEVIIMPQRSTTAPTKAYPLHGTKVEYHEPFKPVSESEWNAC